MKAQRRHDLQENELAKRIVKLPSFFDVYGNKILIAVIIISLIIIVVRWRWNAAEQSQIRAAESLNGARTAITELRWMGVEGLDPQRLSSLRNQLINDARNAIESITSDSEDRKLLAEATLARGDLYWTIANLTDLPGATTQESLRPDVAPDKALDTAESSYKMVIDQYADEKLSAIAARLGLAAIAENKGGWDRARQLYEAVISDSSAPAAYKGLARERVAQLDDLQQPVFIGAATQPAEATTLPAEAGLGPRASMVPPATAAAPATAATVAHPATAATTKP